MVRLSALYIYPIKSAAGISVQTARMTSRGLQHDRRWMVVDKHGKFMTQRKFPRMSLIEVSVEDALRVSAPGMSELVVRLVKVPSVKVPSVKVPSVNKSDRIEVDVWGDRTSAIPVSPESKAWFSQFLGVDCQLVYMPDDAQRPTEHGKFSPDNLVSFADAFPYLLISEASLNGLNEKLQRQGADSVNMNRFRPNLVVSGASEPHAEDAWQQIKIGEATFDLPKLCARCSIPNVDQQTGDRGKEPTQTLSTYRYWDRGIWFGKNAMQANIAAKQIDQVLRVGDAVEILSRQMSAQTNERANK